jgi:hypothetical protein
MTKIIVASRNFANAPKKGFLSIHGLQNSMGRNIKLQMNGHSMWLRQAGTTSTLNKTKVEKVQRVQNQAQVLLSKTVILIF